MTRILLALAACLALPAVASADPAPGTVTGAIVVPTCGQQTYKVGASVAMTQDQTGTLCTVSGGGGGGTVTPGTLTLTPLDVSTVTTGGTAVNALSAGHRNKGGWIANPVGAQPLCINEIGTASGTTSSGSTTCIAAGQVYNLAANGSAVSVISSDSAHPFSGMGWN